MKVLFIANYRDGHNGWSEAAKHYILSMDEVGIDVVCRPIKLNNFIGVIPDKIKKLEEKDLNNVDICIQHTLPNLMFNNKESLINIGMYYKETFSDYHYWDSFLERMDYTIVPNTLMFETENRKPDYLLPVPMDFEEYKNIENANISFGDSYKFYWIGDLNRRKNLKRAIESYYLSFNKSSDVSFIIKASKFGYNESMIHEEIITLCKVVAMNMKLYDSFEKYPPIYVIGNDLSRKQILELHKSLDCLLYPSFGEGWGMVVADAAAIGNDIICNNVGGMKDIINNYNDKNKDLLLTPTEINVLGMDKSLPHLYSSKESWYDTSTIEMCKKMKQAVNNKHLKNTETNLHNFSYKNIGNKMKEILNDISKKHNIKN